MKVRAVRSQNSSSQSLQHFPVIENAYFSDCNHQNHESNTDLLESELAALNYDEAKMPVNAVGPILMKKAFQKLALIGDELGRADGKVDRAMQLSSEYYSLIPRDFGHGNMAVSR